MKVKNSDIRNRLILRDEHNVREKKKQHDNETICFAAITTLKMYHAQ